MGNETIVTASRCDGCLYAGDGIKDAFLECRLRFITMQDGRCAKFVNNTHKTSELVGPYTSGELGHPSQDHPTHGD